MELVEHRAYGPPSPGNRSGSERIILSADSTDLSAPLYLGSPWIAGSIEVNDSEGGFKLMDSLRTAKARVFTCDIALALAFIYLFMVR